MTIDLCTRIWNGRDPWGVSGSAHGPCGADGSAISATEASHDAAMGCVDVAVVVGYASDRLGIRLPDDTVLRSIEENPDRRVGVLGIDVSWEDALARVDSAADMESIVGIAVSPADQDVRPTDDRFVDVLRRASERGLIVMVHNPGMFHPDSDLSFADPRLIDEVLREHHDDQTIQLARLVLGDFGCMPVEHTLAVVAKHQGVFVELSAAAARPGRLQTGVFTAHEFGVASRVLFASGFPRETPERAIERLYSVNPSGGSGERSGIRVPREVLRQIVEGDALGKLGIRHLWAGRAARADAPGSAGARAVERRGLLTGSARSDDDSEDTAW